MNVADTVSELVLARAAQGVRPPESVDARKLLAAFDGDPYAALEAAVAIRQVRTAALRRYIRSTPLRAAA